MTEACEVSLSRPSPCQVLEFCETEAAGGIEGLVSSRELSISSPEVLHTFQEKMFALQDRRHFIVDAGIE